MEERDNSLNQNMSFTSINGDRKDSIVSNSSAKVFMSNDNESNIIETSLDRFPRHSTRVGLS